MSNRSPLTSARVTPTINFACRTTASGAIPILIRLRYASMSEPTFSTNLLASHFPLQPPGLIRMMAPSHLLILQDVFTMRRASPIFHLVVYPPPLRPSPSWLPRKIVVHFHLPPPNLTPSPATFSSHLHLLPFLLTLRSRHRKSLRWVLVCFATRQPPPPLSHPPRRVWIVLPRLRDWMCPVHRCHPLSLLSWLTLLLSPLGALLPPTIRLQIHRANLNGILSCLLAPPFPRRINVNLPPLLVHALLPLQSPPSLHPSLPYRSSLVTLPLNVCCCWDPLHH